MNKKPYSIIIISAILFMLGLQKMFAAFIFQFFFAEYLRIMIEDISVFYPVIPLYPLLEVITDNSFITSLIYGSFGIIQSLIAIFLYRGNNLARVTTIFLLWIEYLSYAILATMIIKLLSSFIFFEGNFEKNLALFYNWSMIGSILLQLLGIGVVNYFLTRKNVKEYSRKDNHLLTQS